MREAGKQISKSECIRNTFFLEKVKFLKKIFQINNMFYKVQTCFWWMVGVRVNASMLWL